MEKIIEVKNLKKSFELNQKQKQQLGKDRLVAVDDISFDVYKGSIFAILGPNGAGKTTTLRCLSTLMKPDSGTIMINDAYDENEIRSHIAFLTSDLNLDRHFTPDYLFDYFSGLYGIKNNPLKEKLFELYGITEFKNTKIANLSTGMKQKLQIVISLVNDPDILIYDEPTNGLDVVLSKEIEEYLLKLKEQGKTIVLSTHILDIVNKLADSLIIINKGKIVFSGSKEELYEKYSVSNLEDGFFAAIKEV